MPAMPFFTNNVIDNSYSLIVFSPLVALFLSLFLVFIYDKTTKDAARQSPFVQSLVLFSIITTMIMQSIGDSMATGFGVFGALAIVRFRLKISNPRDVSFLFASMAIGIACGVHSFTNALVGTGLFAATIIALRFSNFGKTKTVMGVFRFDVHDDVLTELPKIVEIIQQQSITQHLKSYRAFIVNERRKGTEYEYEVRLQTEKHGLVLCDKIKALNLSTDVRLVFQNDSE